jgi:hypothetical protein
MPSIPTNKKLYMKVKSQAKKTFKVWPSAYASGWLVRRYKKLGGKYRTSPSSKLSKRKSVRKSRRRRSKTSMRFSRKRKTSIKSKTKGLSRWFEEEWIDVCELPRIVPCGRKRARKSKRSYPYCRPRYKITSKSPRSARSLSSYEIKKRCKQKRRSPNKRVV